MSANHENNSKENSLATEKADKVASKEEEKADLVSQ